MWKRKKKDSSRPAYDKTGKRPVIRASICTGERVAGFCEEGSGHMEELMLIRNEKDLEEFMALYEVKKEEIETIW